MVSYLIGIDGGGQGADAGTGRFARALCQCVLDDGGRSLGITRHPLLETQGIAHRRHNRAACIAIHSLLPLVELAEQLITAAATLAERAAAAICVVPTQAIDEQVIEFGRRASREMIEVSQARTLADAHGLLLRALTTSGDVPGMIGAMAAVGLRAGGNHGWFHELPGSRQLRGRVCRSELEALGITIDHQSPMELPPADAAVYNTLDWVRPRLRNGSPVWGVDWDKEQHEWIPVDRRGAWSLE
jgi:hypothetical protein